MHGMPVLYDRMSLPVTAYEYYNAPTPKVQKCPLFRTDIRNGVPACVKMCPPQALTFGLRKDLIELAHMRIQAKPDQYIDHIYGEYEVGGTSMLYLAGQPFEQLGLPVLASAIPPQLTETIQHGIFKYFIPQVALYGLLLGIMKMYENPDEDEEQGGIS